MPLPDAAEMYFQALKQIQHTIVRAISLLTLPLLTLLDSNFPVNSLWT